MSGSKGYRGLCAPPEFKARPAPKYTRKGQPAPTLKSRPGYFTPQVELWRARPVAGPTCRAVQQPVTSTPLTSVTPRTPRTIPRPTGTTPRPTSTTPRPTCTTPRPTCTTPRPTGTIPRPTSGTRTPTRTVTRPTGAIPRTTVSSPQPRRSGLRTPSTGTRPTGPCTVVATPCKLQSTGLRTPATGLRTPGSGGRPPTTGLRPPGSGLRRPATGMRPPGSRLRSPVKVVRSPDRVSEATASVVDVGECLEMNAIIESLLEPDPVAEQLIQELNQIEQEMDAECKRRDALIEELKRYDDPSDINYGAEQSSVLLPLNQDDCVQDVQESESGLNDILDEYERESSPVYIVQREATPSETIPSVVEIRECSVSDDPRYSEGMDPLAREELLALQEFERSEQQTQQEFPDEAIPLYILNRQRTTSETNQLQSPQYQHEMPSMRILDQQERENVENALQILENALDGFGQATPALEDLRVLEPDGRDMIPECETESSPVYIVQRETTPSETISSVDVVQPVCVIDESGNEQTMWAISTEDGLDIFSDPGRIVHEVEELESGRNLISDHFTVIDEHGNCQIMTSLGTEGYPRVAELVRIDPEPPEEPGICYTLVRF